MNFYSTRKIISPPQQPATSRVHINAEVSFQCYLCVSKIPSKISKLCGEVAVVRVQLSGCYLMYVVVGFRQVPMSLWLSFFTRFVVPGKWMRVLGLRQRGILHLEWWRMMWRVVGIRSIIRCVNSAEEQALIISLQNNSCAQKCIYVIPNFCS